MLKIVVLSQLNRLLAAAFDYDYGALEGTGSELFHAYHDLLYALRFHTLPLLTYYPIVPIP